MIHRRHNVKPRRRVVMTGIGAITPIGITKENLWSGLRAERSAVSGLTRFDPTPFRSHSAAEVDFVATDHLEAKRAKQENRPARPVRLGHSPKTVSNAIVPLREMLQHAVLDANHIFVGIFR